MIYAFNGVGKTRLSREFKELVAPKSLGDDVEHYEPARNKIIYYNAFTEDLFYWDNDLNNDKEPKLRIQKNSFTDWILKDQGQDRHIITIFQRYTNDKLTPRFNEGFSEVTFSMQRGNDEKLENLKISKGEESNFIWGIFHALIEQIIEILNVDEPEERETREFDDLKYIFIDDPVSSLDENHLIQLAVNLGQLIRASKSDIKFIVLTHNPLFYNVLYNETNVKNGFILSRFDDGSFELEEKQGDSNKSFSYHLHIKKLIDLAIKENSVQRYHFALLRNLYEKTANFLGYNNWSDLLPNDKKTYASRIMNFYTHNTLSNEEISEPTQPERNIIGFLLKNLNKYGYYHD